MRSLCLHFQVHQPFRLRNYRFFDIGVNHHYFDEHRNRDIMQGVAQKCYLPANRLLLELIRKYEGRFKVSFSISGTALDQFELYAPETLPGFQQLADTGCVELVAETYASSLASVSGGDEFVEQVEKHAKKIELLFGQKPVTFRNTGLIYSDQIGAVVSGMGFRAMLTEGAGSVLGYKSPNLLYRSALNPELKLLLRNYRLSDDLTFGFSNYDGRKLTAEKFVSRLNQLPASDEIVNLSMGYETFGEHQSTESGIFEFLRDLPDQLFTHSPYTIVTPAEAVRSHTPVAGIHAPANISWADEERNLSAWLGNELQDSAFEKLYQLEEKVKSCNDPVILRDWLYLQTSDHFYYQCTKSDASGYAHKYFSPYDSPYDAYINYMNVLSDLELRVNEQASKMSAKANLSINAVPRMRGEVIPLSAESLAEKVA